MTEGKAVIGADPYSNTAQAQYMAEFVTELESLMGRTVIEVERLPSGYFGRVVLGGKTNKSDPLEEARLAQERISMGVKIAKQDKENNAMENENLLLATAEAVYALYASLLVISKARKIETLHDDPIFSRLCKAIEEKKQSAESPQSSQQ